MRKRHVVATRLRVTCATIQWRGNRLVDPNLQLRKCIYQGTLTLRFRSCFRNFGTYGLALVNQFSIPIFVSRVPLRMTFANYESTFSKPRMDKNKTTNPFGQTTKRCLTAAGGTFQNYESEFPTTNRDFQTTIGGPQPGIFRLRPDQNSCYETKIRMGKEQPRNYEARGRTVRCVFRE